MKVLIVVLVVFLLVFIAILSLIVDRYIRASTNNQRRLWANRTTPNQLEDPQVRILAGKMARHLDHTKQDPTWLATSEAQEQRDQLLKEWYQND